MREGSGDALEQAAPLAGALLFMWGTCELFIVDKTIGLRPSAEDEQQGLDLTSHGERAYNM